VIWIDLPTLRVGRSLRVSLRLDPPLARQIKQVEYYPPFGAGVSPATLSDEMKEE